jgi:hypothetical protein
VNRLQTPALADVWRDLNTAGLPEEPEAREEELVHRWCDALARWEISIFTRAGRRALGHLIRINPDLAGLVIDELCDAYAG